MAGFGDVFCEIGVRELQQSANEAFNEFGDAHRQMEKYGIQMLKRLKPVSTIQYLFLFLSVCIHFYHHYHYCNYYG